MGFIYKIENNINHKAYIGKTEKVNPMKRWSEHLAESKKERNLHRALYRAIHKYGIENFTFSILEETENCSEREKFYISLYKTFTDGYNETLGGDGSPRLNLNEDEVCTYYKDCRTLRTTAEHFGVDKESISKILYKHGITKTTAAELNKINFSKKVQQIDTSSGEVLNIFDSTVLAEQYMTGKITHGASISRVCLGKRKQAYGYGWQYVS